MTSMMMTKAEAKTMLGDCCPSDASNAPKYPYGLSFSLDEGSMKKLGMTELMAVGHKYTMIVKCEVTSTSQRQEQDGDTNMHMELQITDIEMGDDSKPKTDRADKMYPSMKK
jgi:hypothetical protein